MTEERMQRYQTAAVDTVGHEGRMISSSKSWYREQHPTNAPIFNANICLLRGKLWHGDLDLTVDEAKLADLARRIREIVYVLHEHDGRFHNETKPLLAHAVYSITPSGHTDFDFRNYERDRDGVLRRRPPEPIRGPRWSWAVLAHKPRLFRPWILERDVNTSWRPITGETITSLYVGKRRPETPFLVLSFFRSPRLRKVAFEWTWYPARDRYRAAARPLIRVTPHLHLGALRIWLSITAWPGLEYQLYGGYVIRRWYER